MEILFAYFGVLSFVVYTLLWLHSHEGLWIITKFLVKNIDHDLRFTEPEMYMAMCTGRLGKLGSLLFCKFCLSTHLSFWASTVVWFLFLQTISALPFIFIATVSIPIIVNHYGRIKIN